MISPTFLPPREHLGDVIKTKYGEYDTAQFAGLNDRYEAIYTRGAALVKAVTPVYSSAYLWSSANFFTGLDSNLLEFVTPVRDLVSAVDAGLSLIESVLGILQSMASLGANILKALIDRVLSLLTAILDIFNPDYSLHMLVIPPKIGNVGKLPDPQIDPEVDSLRVQNAKRSEKSRQDFIRYLSNLHTRLPGALGRQVKEVADQQYGVLGGSEYLLRVLDKKLNDTGDLARPNLQQSSEALGVGIFVGSSAINQFVDVWGKLTSLWGSTLDLSKYALSGMPEAPVIASHRINAVNSLAKTSPVTRGSFSPTQMSVMVRPVIPRGYIVTGNVEYYFSRRVVYVSTVLDTYSSMPEEKFKDLLTEVLSRRVASPSTFDSVVEPLSSTRYSPGPFANPYTVTSLTSESAIETYRSDVIPEKLAVGSYYLIAADFYTLSGSAYASSYLYRLSNVTRFSITPEKSALLKDKFITVRDMLRLDYDPNASYPQWIATPYALSLFPDAIGTLVEFINYLNSTLQSLLDDALDWLKILLDNLRKVIRGLREIISLIDKLIELFQLLASLTGSLGVSVLKFEGSGDSQALYSMFQDYLNPSTSTSTNIGLPNLESTTAEDELNRLEQFASSVESNLPGTLIRNGASYLDSTGSIDIVRGQRQLVRDRELQKVLGSRTEDATGLSAVVNTSYNKSPIFTSEMTTGGIVLMGHFTDGESTASLRALLDLLFGSSENASEENEATLLASKGLAVNTRNLVPEVESSRVSDPPAIFTANMGLTESTSNSPFNFCPLRD